MTRAVGADSDAILLLQAEHRTLAALLDRAGRDARALARFRSALVRHAEAEEEVLHPALRDAGGDRRLLEAARVDHGRLRRVAAGIASARRGTEPFRARLAELRSALEDHVRAEEGAIFGAVLASIPRPQRVALAERMECLAQGRSPRS